MGIIILGRTFFLHRMTVSLLNMDSLTDYRVQRCDMRHHYHHHRSRYCCCHHLISVYLTFLSRLRHKFAAISSFLQTFLWTNMHRARSEQRSCDQSRKKSISSMTRVKAQRNVSQELSLSKLICVNVWSSLIEMPSNPMGERERGMSGIPVQFTLFSFVVS